MVPAKVAEPAAAPEGGWFGSFTAPAAAAPSAAAPPPRQQQQQQQVNSSSPASTSSAAQVPVNEKTSTPPEKRSIDLNNSNSSNSNLSGRGCPESGMGSRGQSEVSFTDWVPERKQSMIFDRTDKQIYGSTELDKMLSSSVSWGENEVIEHPDNAKPKKLHWAKKLRNGIFGEK